MLTSNLLQHGPVDAAHVLHVGFADSVKNLPGFTGFLSCFLMDDYVCSKQQLENGLAALRPVRVAFCVLKPEASTNPFAGRRVQVFTNHNSQFDAP